MSQNSTLPEETVQYLRQCLSRSGAASVTDTEGRRIVLATARHVGISEEALMVAYEDHGMKIVGLERPVTAMKLVQGGFSMTAAAMVAEMVNRVAGLVHAAPMVGGGAVTAKALSSAKKREE